MACGVLKIFIPYQYYHRNQKVNTKGSSKTFKWEWTREKYTKNGLEAQIQNVCMGSRRQGQQSASRTPGAPCSRSCTAKYTWCPRRWWGAPRCSAGWTPETRWSKSLSTSFAPNPQYGVDDGGDYGLWYLAPVILEQVFHSLQLHNLTMSMELSNLLDTPGHVKVQTKTHPVGQKLEDVFENEIWEIHPSSWNIRALLKILLLWSTHWILFRLSVPPFSSWSCSLSNFIQSFFSPHLWISFPLLQLVCISYLCIFQLVCPTADSQWGNFAPQSLPLLLMLETGSLQV